MIQKTFILKNESGLHARPASVFVVTASRFQSDVTLIRDKYAYNAKSILGILSMGASMGTELVLEVSGEDEEAAMEALLQVLEAMS